MEKCYACSDKVNEIFDAGMHPISNRYLTDKNNKEYTFQLILGQCDGCGLVQLTSLVPYKNLTPMYDWVTYNEPETHLDNLVEIINNLPGINNKSRICGLSYKEKSTLKRLNNLGYNNTWGIDLYEDLHIQNTNAGIETLQEVIIHSDVLDSILSKHGKSDIVIARHILEHSYDIKNFMNAIKRLVSKSGYVVFEIPDCTKVFNSLDYSTIWEEHIIYFTPETFKNTLDMGGFNLIHFEQYPYPYEDSLVAIVTTEKATNKNQDINVEKERNVMNIFAKEFDNRRKVLNNFLSSFRKENGKIAIFGAGHSACMFINLMGIKDFIEFAVDDHPNKRGLFIPGSKLPIYNSSYLKKKNIKLCLLSLSPESERKVINNNKEFIRSGGRFFSIFPKSNYALQIS
tara:strand:- start:2450 stop:3649 length:1200 start_codon:yes stop_codon:yes gene_type:complete